MSHGKTQRGAGVTGARGIISGSISNGASWHEDLEISENGTQITDAELLEWRFTFRHDYQDAPILTLTTTDNTLTIDQSDDDVTTIQIRVPYTSLSDMEGDYIADLASKDDDDRVIHWCHGQVTFRNEPIWDS